MRGLNFCWLNTYIKLILCFLWFIKWGQQIFIHSSCYTSFLERIEKFHSKKSWFCSVLVVRINCSRQTPVVFFKRVNKSINTYFLSDVPQDADISNKFSRKGTIYTCSVWTQCFPLCCLHTCSYILFLLFVSYLNPKQWKYLDGHLYSGRDTNSVNIETNKNVWGTDGWGLKLNRGREK